MTSWTYVLVGGWELERILFRVMLAGLVFKFTKDAFVAWRARAKAEPPPTSDLALPRVTVQLPMRNEFYVADRVIRAVAAFDYPRELLEIQVLDDSNDETVGLVDATVARLKARGIDVKAIRRTKAEGAKAGALAYGMESATGDFIAIFDADFLPEPDFLKRTMGYFLSDPKVGMVQGRWEFVNRSASLLTQVQAVILDGLMLVEQPAKSASGQPIHFNGTAGVWRRACVDDAGGWSSATVTEDLELSFRAQRRGWRLVHLPTLAVPTELPETMVAYRTQQRRWTRGNAQVVRSMWWSLATGEMPLLHRFGMLGRTLSRLIFVGLAFLTLTMPFSTFEWLPRLFNYNVAIDAATVLLVLGAHLAFYLPARRLAGRSAWHGMVLVPAVMALYIGMSLSLAIAYAAGILVKQAEFVRTPKSGGLAQKAADRARYRLPVDLLAILELGIGLAYYGFSALAFSRGFLASAVFFFLWASAHTWVGGATVMGSLESVSGASAARRRAAELALRVASELTPRADGRGLKILAAELARSRRSSASCAIVLLAVPDVAAGTAPPSLLDMIRGLASDALRAYDSVVTLESGRVLVVLPEADETAATKVAARLRARIEMGIRDDAFSVRLVPLTPLDRGETAAALIARADAQLDSTLCEAKA